YAVHPTVLVPDPLDVQAQRLVTPGPLRSALRFRLARFVQIVGRRRDRQDVTDRLDTVDLAMVVDERHHPFPGRSSSAWAKYAEALRRISLARLSSRTSRSSAFSRSRSSLVTPGLWPWSRSAWRTHLRS